jgi:3-isopropylmalate/(R)-2-methylmalate dehydratase small subunit
MDYGIRVVIAPSFSDIFYSNSMKNGLLPVRLPAAEVRRLLDLLHASPGTLLSVDLPGQAISDPSGNSINFPIESFPKECLIKGLDEIAMTLEHEADIGRYEREWKAKTPWLFPDI